MWVPGMSACTYAIQQGPGRRSRHADTCDAQWSETVMRVDQHGQHHDLAHRFARYLLTLLQVLCRQQCQAEDPAPINYALYLPLPCRVSPQTPDTHTLHSRCVILACNCSFSLNALGGAFEGFSGSQTTGETPTPALDLLPFLAFTAPSRIRSHPAPRSRGHGAAQGRGAGPGCDAGWQRHSGHPARAVCADWQGDGRHLHGPCVLAVRVRRPYPIFVSSPQPRVPVPCWGWSPYPPCQNA